MSNEIAQNGGRIDKIYFAPNLESENHPDRKPNPGMAWQALKDYPDIDFERSIMIGDSLSDMQFGKNAEMVTIFLTNETFENQVAVDYIFKDLYDFAINGLKYFV
jgi:HAD superfamily hydrolase (TIGR01662 family)